MTLPTQQLLQCDSVTQIIDILSQPVEKIDNVPLSTKTPNPLIARLVGALEQPTVSKKGLYWFPSYINAHDLYEDGKIDKFEDFCTLLHSYAQNNTPYQSQMTQSIEKLNEFLKTSQVPVADHALIAHIFKEFFIAELFNKITANEFIQLYDYVNNLNVQEKNLALIIKIFWRKLPDFINEGKIPFCVNLLNRIRQMSPPSLALNINQSEIIALIKPHLNDWCDSVALIDNLNYIFSLYDLIKIIPTLSLGKIFLNAHALAQHLINRQASYQTAMIEALISQKLCDGLFPNINDLINFISILNEEKLKEKLLSSLSQLAEFVKTITFDQLIILLKSSNEATQAHIINAISIDSYRTLFPGLLQINILIKNLYSNQLKDNFLITIANNKICEIDSLLELSSFLDRTFNVQIKILRAISPEDYKKILQNSNDLIKHLKHRSAEYQQEFIKMIPADHYAELFKDLEKDLRPVLNSLNTPNNKLLLFAIPINVFINMTIVKLYYSLISDALKRKDGSTEEEQAKSLAFEQHFALRVQRHDQIAQALLGTHEIKQIRTDDEILLAFCIWELAGCQDNVDDIVVAIKAAEWKAPVTLLAQGESSSSSAPLPEPSRLSKVASSFCLPTRNPRTWLLDRNRGNYLRLNEDTKMQEITVHTRVQLSPQAEEILADLLPQPNEINVFLKKKR